MGLKKASTWLILSRVRPHGCAVAETTAQVWGSQRAYVIQENQRKRMRIPAIGSGSPGKVGPADARSVGVGCGAWAADPGVENIFVCLN